MTTSPTTTATTPDPFARVLAYEGLSLSAVVDGLKQFTTYEFQVSSATKIGATMSEWSQFTTGEGKVLGVPNPIVEVESETSLAVTIRKPKRATGKIVSYSVLIDGKTAAKVSTTGTVSIGGLKTYTTYEVTIVACNSASCTDSQGIVARTGQGAPEKVHAPVGQASSSTAIALKWTAPAKPNGVIAAYEVSAAELYTCTGDEGVEPVKPGCQYVVCAKNEDVCGSRCYSPDTYQCCAGQLHRKLSQHMCCGTTYLKTSGDGAQTCCGDALVTKKSSHMCCKGKYVAADKGEICCDGNVGKGDQCCAAQPYASTGLAPKLCCAGKLYDALNNRQCCGDRIISGGSVCCSSDRESKPFTKKAGMECCSTSYVASATSTCCDGQLHKYSSTQHKAQANQVCCGKTVVAQSAGCCNGKGFNPVTQVCADRSTEGKGDTCGIGLVCPASKKAVSFCDQCNFDIDSHVCRRVDNQAAAAAAVVVGAKRTSSGGVVHNPKLTTCQYTQCKIDENICDGVCYGSKKVCCDGKLHDSENGKQCCGTSYVKRSGSQICCGNNVFSREADKKCCGDKYKVVLSGQICCSGTVGKGNKCCGARPFTDSDNADQVCCAGTLFARDASRQCCGGSMVSRDLQCCGNDDAAKAFVKNSAMSCCGSGYVLSATTLCCSSSGSAISYTYPSPGAKLSSTDKCCATSKIPFGMSCCHGEAFNPVVSVCADRASDGESGCGTATICPVQAAKGAYCNTCNFNAKTSVCSARKVEVKPSAEQCSRDAKLVYKGGAEQSAAISKLAPYTAYRFTLTAYTKGGNTASPTSGPIRTREAAPDGVTAPALRATSTTEMLVTWKAPSQPQGLIISYKILEGKDKKIIIAAKGPGNATISKLQPYELKTVVLEVCTSAGCTLSGAVAVRTLQAVPTGPGKPKVTALDGGTSVQLEFTGPSQANGIILYFVAVVGGEKRKPTDPKAPKIVIDGLKPFTVYKFAAQTCTSAGCATSEEIEAKTLEAPPSKPLKAPKLYVLDSKRLEASWEAPTVPNGVITQYELFRGEDVIYKGDKLKFVDEKLKANSEYTFTYKAYTSAGGTTSEASTANTPESTPEGLARPNCTAKSSSEISLKWEAPTTPNGKIAHYEVIIDTEKPSKVGLETAYVANRFKPYTKHAFRIKACTRVGCATSEECAAYTAESAPMSMNAPKLKVKDSSNIIVTWEAPKAPNGVITSYTLESKSKTEAKFATVFTSEKGAKVLKTSFTHAKLEPYTEYEYRVVAANTAGAIVSESSRAITQHAAPSAMGKPTVAFVTANSAEVKWVAPKEPNGIITRYLVSASFVDKAGSDATVKPLYTGLDTKTTLRGLKAYTEYTITVVAETTGGKTPSPEVAFTTLESVPGGVSAPTVTKVDTTQITLKWVAPANPNGAITVYRVLVAEPKFVAKEMYKGTRSTYTVSQLKPFQTYVVTLQACTAAGCASSTPRSVTTLEALPEGLGAPTVVLLAATTVTMKWSPPAQPNGIITRYDVYRSTDDCDNLKCIVHIKNVKTPFTDTKLSPYTEYKYAVSAVNKAGSSYEPTHLLEAGKGSGSGSKGDEIEGADDEAAILTVTTKAASPDGMGTARRYNNITAPNAIHLTWDAPTAANGPDLEYIVRWREVQVPPLEAQKAPATTGTRAVLPGLDSLVDYDVWIEAANTAGTTSGPVSQFQTCGRSPGRPSAPTVVDTTASNIGLVWEAPETNGATPIYIVRIGSTEVYRGSLKSHYVDITNIAQSNKTHEITLEACIANGCSSEYKCSTSSALSYHVRARAHIATPTAYVLSDSSIDIAWKPPSNGVYTDSEITYMLYRGDKVVYSGKLLSHLDLQLSPAGSTFEYAVRAKDDKGLDIVSPIRSATLTKGAPNGVTVPRLRAISDELIQVRWDVPIDPQGRIQRYGLLVNDVERYYDIDGTVQQQFIDNLDAYTAYHVRLRACNDKACGTSQAVAVTTKCGKPSAVTVVVTDSRDEENAKPGEENLIRLAWEAPTKLRCKDIKYAVEYTSDYRKQADASVIRWERGFVTDTLSYSMDGLELEQDLLYHFRVVTQNGKDDEEGGDAGLRTTYGQWVKYDSRAQKPRNVRKPVVTQNKGSSSLFVSWKPPGKTNGIILNYKVSVTSPGNLTIITTEQNFINLDDVPAAATYQFVVIACNKEGCTPSEPTTFQTDETLPDGLAAPIVSSVRANRFTVAWKPPSQPNGKVTGYHLDLKACPPGESKDGACSASQVELGNEGDASGFSQDITQLSAYTAYKITLVSRNSAGNTSATPVRMTTAEAKPKAFAGPLLSMSASGYMVCNWTDTFRNNGVLTMYTVVIKAGNQDQDPYTEKLNLSRVQLRTIENWLPEEGFQPNTLYTCHVTAQTKAGESKEAVSNGFLVPARNETNVIPEAEASSSDAAMNAGDTAGLIIGLLILALLVGGIVFAYRRMKAAEEVASVAGAELAAATLANKFWLAEEEAIEIKPRLRNFTPPPMRKAIFTFDQPAPPSDQVGQYNFEAAAAALSMGQRSQQVDYITPVGSVADEHELRESALRQQSGGAQSVELLGYNPSDPYRQPSMLPRRQFSQASAMAPDESGLYSPPPRNNNIVPNRFSVTDLSGTFNPSLHNVPRLPSLRNNSMLHPMPGTSPATAAMPRPLSMEFGRVGMAAGVPESPAYVDVMPNLNAPGESPGYLNITTTSYTGGGIATSGQQTNMSLADLSLPGHLSTMSTSAYEDDMTEDTRL